MLLQAAQAACCCGSPIVPHDPKAAAGCTRSKLLQGLESLFKRRNCCRLRKLDSAGPPDVILDLESPAKVSRRALSLRQAGTAVMQDANAFAEEQEAGTPKSAKPQFPLRAQVGNIHIKSLRLHSFDSADLESWRSILWLNHAKP